MQGCRSAGTSATILHSAPSIHGIPTTQPQLRDAICAPCCIGTMTGMWPVEPVGYGGSLSWFEASEREPQIQCSLAREWEAKGNPERLIWQQREARMAHEGCPSPRMCKAGQRGHGGGVGQKVHNARPVYRPQMVLVLDVFGSCGMMANLRLNVWKSIHLSL